MFFLQFQRIFTIGLERRTDRHDLMTLGASVSEMDIDWFPGVTEDDLDNTVIPEGWKESKGAIGCWRAHMNVLNHIISNNIQTALIIEDDTDWDISLRQQLSDFATGINRIQTLTDPSNPASISPYGPSWDLLWLGHCRIGPHNDRQPMYVLEDDITVPPIPYRVSLWNQRHIPPPVLSNSSRVIFRAVNGMCTYGYAITLAGARKLVASLLENNLPYDVAMSSVCREKKVKPFRCYASYPPLMASHRFQGTSHRNSDIRPDRPGSSERDEFTRDIVFPVMLNIKKLVAGKTTVKSQWPLDTRDSWSVGRKINARGRVVWMDLNKLKETWIRGINSIFDGRPSLPMF